jgi:hypothetical protein
LRTVWPLNEVGVQKKVARSDIRRVAAESRRLPDADHHNLTRMLVSLNGIYGHGVLQSLQGVTLLPELIPAFLAAVMETMGSHPK